MQLVVLDLLPSNLLNLKASCRQTDEDWLLTYFIFYDILEHGNWELKFGWTVRQTHQIMFINNQNFPTIQILHLGTPPILTGLIRMYLWISMKTFDYIFSAFDCLVQQLAVAKLKWYICTFYSPLIRWAGVPQNSSCDNLTNWQTGIFLVTISNNF